MIGVYIVMGVTALTLAVVVLSFLGPEHSEKPFWQTVQKIRAVIDKVSYYVICAISVGMLGLVVAAIAASVIGKYQEDRSVPGVIVSVAILAGIGTLVFFGIRSLVREHNRGVRCECVGDCTRCKIQCRSNPNYYGIRKKTAEKDEEGEERQKDD